MRKSFYQYVLSFRGGSKEDEKSVFAEEMFRDLSFPKQETAYDTLSRYVEELGNDDMKSIVFDELYALYEENI
ncbi:MAG TPA: YozE family protein [Sporosarcina sp.]|nr:YozE family protein [Sporosarcina sp.]